MDHGRSTPARVKTAVPERPPTSPTPEERAAYLDRECGGDARVSAARVEALLAVDGPGRARSPTPRPPAPVSTDPRPRPPGATQRIASETVPGVVPVSDQDPGLATVGDHRRRRGGTIRSPEVPPVARIGRFVPGRGHRRAIHAARSPRRGRHGHRLPGRAIPAGQADGGAQADQGSAWTRGPSWPGSTPNARRWR